MTLAIIVDTQTQELTLYDNGKVIKRYLVSTAKNGLGEASGSYCTPRGKHIIRAKIGQGVPLGGVFVGRRFTQEIYTQELAALFPARDWILTRILWLSGLEPGVNRLAKVDTMRRFIYIHGTPDTKNLGLPVSHGCVRMSNEDVLDLFDRVEVSCPVTIV